MLAWLKKQRPPHDASELPLTAEPAKVSTEPLPQVDDSAQTATGSRDGDGALDTVVAFLRVYGSHAFDVEDCGAERVRQQCEQWATKIAIGCVEDVRREGQFRRDWAGVRRFLGGHRQREAAYVSRSLTSLRSTIGDFAQCLEAAVTEERESDRQIERDLDGLNGALQQGDADQIRACTLRVLARVRTAVGHRRSREERQLEVLSQRLQSLTTELSVARERATIDPLTQLYNRGAFDEQLARLSELGFFYGQPPVLLLLDVDHFKAINDRLGHPAGDQVLKQLADTLVRTFLRKQDFVCRCGGEEFAVLILDTSEERAGSLARRLLASVRAMSVMHEGVLVPVSASLGVAFLKPGEKSHAWMARADRALYAAKQAGRDRVHIAD